jgi:hypothetical protein
LDHIAEWLEKLGMSEYAERFAENRIDLSVLPDLTDQDLKELGVILGDRRKILRAIAGLKSTEAEAVRSNEETFSNLAIEEATLPRQDAAERRQVTGDVLRLGRLNGPLGPHGPGGPPRGY